MRLAKLYSKMLVKQLGLLGALGRWWPLTFWPLLLWEHPGKTSRQLWIQTIRMLGRSCVHRWERPNLCKTLLVWLCLSMSRDVPSRELTSSIENTKLQVWWMSLNSIHLFLSFQAHRRSLRDAPRAQGRKSPKGVSVKWLKILTCTSIRAD